MTLNDRALGLPSGLAKSLPPEAEPPLVSVIVTTYNHAHFLGEAIQSAIDQAGGPIEIIVVDDGSTDNPGAVVARFRDVRLIRQENLGLSAARNTGWRAAHGQYLVFLDADDRLLPEAIASNLKTIVASPDYAFVFGRYRIIDADGRVLQVDWPAPDIKEDVYQTLLEGNCIGMHATVMYRRDRIAEAGGFDPRLRACEDYDLYLRITRRYKVGFTAGCLAEYRHHAGNMSGDLPLMLDSALRVLRLQRSHIGANSRWHDAYKRGIRDWKSFYLQQYRNRVRNSSRNWRHKATLVHDGASLFRLAPIELMWIVLRAAYGRVRKLGRN